MQQSTLMGWLSKSAEPKVLPPPPGHNAPEMKDDDESPQPPPNTSSQDVMKLDGETSDGKMCSTGVHTKSEVRSVPPNVEIRACTKDDINALKHLTGLLLPVPYPEKFYREIIEDEVTNSITLVAIWHNSRKDKGILVGATRCRLLAHTPSQEVTPTSHKDGPMLYLSTLAILSPYRSHGIATHMLNVITKRAVTEYGITSVGAHVWEANVDGLEWYRKRGFQEVGREEGYYRRLKPSTAVVMQRRVGVMDLVGG